MPTRRSFFKELIGQVGVMRDEMKGVENIPLRRLNELPTHILEELEPIFFPGETWELVDFSLRIQNGKGKPDTIIQLSETQVHAFRLFHEELNLMEISRQISLENGESLSDTFETVSSFFFTLASHRICHPVKVYHIDEILHDPDR